MPGVSKVNKGERRKLLLMVVVLSQALASLFHMIFSPFFFLFPVRFSVPNNNTKKEEEKRKRERGKTYKLALAGRSGFARVLA